MRLQELNDEAEDRAVRAERLEEAATAYRTALEVDPASPEAARGLASALARTGQVEQALGVLRRALTFEPRNAGCWNGLVALLCAAGDPVEARRAAERAMELGLQLDPGVLAAIAALPAGPAEERNQP